MFKGLIIGLVIAVAVLLLWVIILKIKLWKIEFEDTAMELKRRDLDIQRSKIEQRERESSELIRTKQARAEAELATFKSVAQKEMQDVEDLIKSEKAKALLDLVAWRTEAEKQADYDLTVYTTELRQVKSELAQLEDLRSSIYALPYLAGVFADFETRGIELLAQQLDWGFNQERMKKVRSLRILRRETKEMLAQYKTAQYQLEYAIRMFPALADFLDTDYGEFTELNLTDISSDEHDSVRDYISKEEYTKLSTVDRNQLALDRYRESHRKSKWQIGRDYELYIGYRYEQKGYTVDYCGSRDKLEDLGRDLIATNEDHTLIIQCKYWSTKKLIHENHINQLYGTMMCYCFEHNISVDSVRGILVTNITASDTAKKFANYLGIEIAEKIPLKEYPCIKCNINNSHGDGTTRIYHLPFDQMYDACQINAPGEFMAMTVAEAEAAGFRRAYRWHGEK